MADDQNYLDALQEERRGYAAYGKADRLKEVDAEIARVRRVLGVADRSAAPSEPEGKPQRVTRRKG